MDERELPAVDSVMGEEQDLDLPSSDAQPFTESGSATIDAERVPPAGVRTEDEADTEAFDTLAETPDGWDEETADDRLPEEGEIPVDPALLDERGDSTADRL